MYTPDLDITSKYGRRALHTAKLQIRQVLKVIVILSPMQNTTRTFLVVSKSSLVSDNEIRCLVKSYAQNISADSQQYRINLQWSVQTRRKKDKNINKQSSSYFFISWEIRKRNKGNFLADFYFQKSLFLFLNQKNKTHQCILNSKKGTCLNVKVQQLA